MLFSGKDDLIQTSSILHDYWFDLDSVMYNQRDNKVVISFFETKRKLQQKQPQHILIIRNVKDIEIKDKEKVGFYDLESIDFDSNLKKITINGNIPLTIGIYVTGLNTELIQI